MRPVSSLSLVAVALALVAAGCGESAAKKKEKFLAKAISTCKHFEGLQNQVRVPSVNPVSPKTSHTFRAQWGLAIKQIGYLGTQEIKALGKLEPPKDIEEDFDRFVSTKGGAYALMLKGADAAKRNHISEIKAPIEASRAGFTQASKQARAIGLPACA